jgi:signal peptidase I
MRDSEIFSGVIEQALASGTVVRFRAEGESMYPTIRDGETVTVTPVRSDAIARADIVLFRHGRRLLAHRVVEVTVSSRERVFQLRGDAKGAADGPVPASAIVGKVVDVRRDGRQIPLTGVRARVRRRVRATLSRVRRMAAPTTAVVGAVAAGVAVAAHFRRR